MSTIDSKTKAQLRRSLSYERARNFDMKRDLDVARQDFAETEGRLREELAETQVSLNHREADLAVFEAALERVGCQDAGSCGKGEPDGLCFVCAAIEKVESGS